MVLKSPEAIERKTDDSTPNTQELLRKVSSTNDLDAWAEYLARLNQQKAEGHLPGYDLT